MFGNKLLQTTYARQGKCMNETMHDKELSGARAALPGLDYHLIDNTPVVYLAKCAQLRSVSSDSTLAKFFSQLYVSTILNPIRNPCV